MEQNSKRLKKFFRQLPKIELHRHLEGSLRLTTMLEIAQAFNLDLPHLDPPLFRQLVQVIPGETYDYRNFLSKFKTLRMFYRTPEIIQRITREAVEDAAQDNIRHLEIRFTPVALGVIRQIPPAEVIDLVIEAARLAGGKEKISWSLIVSMNRHESVELAEKVVRAALDRKDDGVAGLDLAGDEANFSARPFAPLLKDARKGGLPLTVHAGEWGGPENVVEAIETLEAERIGHGVRVMEDEAAVRLAIDNGTVFEVCPTSNYQTGVCNDLVHHPLKAMIEAGIRTTLNTDDPGVSAIKLTHEFVNAHQYMNISMDQLRAVTLQAAENAFLPPENRASLAAEISVDFDRLVSEQALID